MQRRFSAIPIDQFGAVGLTENPSALRRWMVARQEVARVILENEELVHDRDSESTNLHRGEDAIVKRFSERCRILLKNHYGIE